jgi:hypothetical protein
VVFRFISFVVWLIAVDGAIAGENGSIELPKATRSIPGLTGVDSHPGACMDCHIQMSDIGLDVRLSTALREWERKVPAKLMAIAEDTVGPGTRLTGRHPSVVMPLEDVPSTCINCHRTASAAPPFDRLIHLAHYRGGDENHFLSIFGGECTLCHKMDQETGAWRIPSGPEKAVQ